MKNYFFIIAVMAAMVCTSCEKLRVAYSTFGYAQVVCKQAKDGSTVYGIGHSAPNDKVVADTPVIFSDYTPTCRDGGYFLYTPGKKTYYFFDVEGIDILSGKRCESPDLEGLIPIINDGKDHRLSEAETYWRHVVGYRYRDSYVNHYFIFPVASGNVCAVAYNGDFAAMGPYKKFLFGLHGFIYQDIETGKWGARTIANFNMDTSDRNIERDMPEIFAPEYDEVIEVECRDETSIWFARKGKVWTSREVIAESSVKDIPVNQQLLNRVLKMKISKEPRKTVIRDLGTTNILAYGQRFGSAEASIAHL